MAGGGLAGENETDGSQSQLEELSGLAVSCVVGARSRIEYAICKLRTPKTKFTSTRQVKQERQCCEAHGKSHFERNVDDDRGPRKRTGKGHE